MQAHTAKHTASQPLEDGASWRTMLSGLVPAVWSARAWRADELSSMWSTIQQPCRSVLAPCCTHFRVMLCVKALAVLCGDVGWCWSSLPALPQVKALHASQLVPLTALIPCYVLSDPGVSSCRCPLEEVSTLHQKEGLSSDGTLLCNDPGQLKKGNPRGCEPVSVHHAQN